MAGKIRMYAVLVSLLLVLVVVNLLMIYIR
jgi:hypothetical protein